MIYQKDKECLSREEIRALQGERLKKTVKLVYDNVPLYRERMIAKGVTPDDIKTVDDIKLLPFTEKTDLRD